MTQNAIMGAPINKLHCLTRPSHGEIWFAPYAQIIRLRIFTSDLVISACSKSAPSGPRLSDAVRAPSTANAESDWKRRISATMIVFNPLQIPYHEHLTCRPLPGAW